jgi:hypothetical protein
MTRSFTTTICTESPCVNKNLRYAKSVSLTIEILWKRYCILSHAIRIIHLARSATKYGVRSPRGSTELIRTVRNTGGGIVSNVRLKRLRICF